jgi:NAD(P)-dependent dehydrogenase (short-subunit alcohol dehydrogenase family)
MTASIKQKVVLITGASTGFGQLMARLLHEQGYRVWGTTRGKVEAGRNPHGDFRLISCNVDDDASAQAAVEHVIATEGRIDVLVNNAGFGIYGALEETSVEEAKAVMETNFFGMHRMCRAVLPSMRARGSGQIINISSISGRIAAPFQGIYSASKFAVEGYSESMRYEVRPFGIEVTMVEPGDFSTGFLAARHFTAEAAATSYDPWCSTSCKLTLEGVSKGPGPELVAVAVLKAIEARSPKLRYLVGKREQKQGAVLKGLVPYWIFERSIAKYYGVSAP